MEFGIAEFHGVGEVDLQRRKVLSFEF